jgi:hypothetical protein
MVDKTRLRFDWIGCKIIGNPNPDPSGGINYGNNK